MMSNAEIWTLAALLDGPDIPLWHGQENSHVRRFFPFETFAIRCVPVFLQHRRALHGESPLHLAPGFFKSFQRFWT